MDINFLMATVQIPSQHDRLLGSQLLQVLCKVDIPLLQSVVQPFQTVSRVGYIGVDNVQVWVLSCDQAPLLIMLVPAHAVMY